MSQSPLFIIENPSRDEQRDWRAENNDPPEKSIKIFWCAHTLKFHSVATSTRIDQSEKRQRVL